MEAMAMGRPAATIDWSGSTEFMKRHNSLLISPAGKLVPVDWRLVKTRPRFYEGQKWADVSVEEVRRVMRLAFEKPEMLRAVGKNGMNDMRREFSIERVAQHIFEIATSQKIGDDLLNREGPPRVLIRPRWLRAVRKVASFLQWRLRKRQLSV
jgi:hypothetical protein